MRRYAEHFSWHEPVAGPVAFPRVNFSLDSDDFCADLLNKKGVLLLPGRLFGSAPAHFRIGFGRRDFQQGLQKLTDYMKENF